MSFWFFEPRNPLGVHTAPKHDEHFALARGVVTSLVRETTQNSGDAADPSTGKPVRMTFRFGRVEPGRFAACIDGLAPHLESFPKLTKTLEDARSVPFLAIEDFETHGLRGSSDPTSEVADSGYVAFWHRYGESGKTRQSGGRHGLGKSTIASASRLRLFFGATVPSDSNPRHLLLQGQISLLSHEVVEVSGARSLYDAYGLWYDRDERERVVPLKDRAAVPFCHDFKLQRGRSPGLSLVIPFPHEDLDEDTVVRAVIENCFHQIITKQLVVEVGTVTIDAGGVRELAALHGLGALDGAMDVSAEVARGKLALAGPRKDAPKARLEPEHFDEETLKLVRRKWVDGKTVAVSLPVFIRPKGRTVETGEVQLFARRVQDEKLARETYIRGRVSVPMKRLSDSSNFVGLLVADLGIASTFLGDSEPPAHDRWVVARLKEGYFQPEAALNRIKYALRDLLGILDAGEDVRPIKDAFADYLWSPTVEAEEDEPRAPVRPPKAQVDLPITPPSPHQIDRVHGGFAYRYGGSDGAALRIAVGYRRRLSGKKAKAAKFEDFGGELEFDEVGSADITQTKEPRRILFNIENAASGYTLRVTGFDPNRDLEVKLQTEDA